MREADAAQVSSEDEADNHVHEETEFAEIEVKASKVAAKKKANKPLSRHSALYKDVVREMTTNLSQIVSLGNQICIAAGRQNEWMVRSDKTPRPLEDAPRSASSSSTETGGGDRNAVHKVAIHAGDRVLYSKLKSVQYIKENIEETATRHEATKTPAQLFQWPIDYTEFQKRDKVEWEGARDAIRTGQKPKSAKSDVDRDWEYYYGDGVDAQDFSQRRSQKRKIGDISNGSAPGSMMELQDFIQRAWDKAVHIASNTMAVRAESPQTNVAEHLDAPSGSLNESDDGDTQNDKTSSHRSIQAKAVLKCKQLNIEFDPIYVPDDDPHYTCQSCNERMPYVSNENVMRHLFGSINEKGCCWKLVQEKQHSIAQQILEREAMNIIDNLLHVAFKQAKEESCAKDDENPQTHPLNWLDVCNAMMETLNKPTNVRWSDIDHNIQTMQIDQDMLPFPLSKDVMKVVFSRLIERYDDPTTAKRGKQNA